jgi:serine/threonine protein kinase
VTKSGIKLLDFGLVKMTRENVASDETVTRGLTQEGTILGTLQYMAPEQLKGGEADARSDIFAFGCVLHELLTGEPAFAATSRAGIIAAIMEREPKALPGVPAKLERRSALWLLWLLWVRSPCWLARQRYGSVYALRRISSGAARR